MRKCSCGTNIEFVKVEGAKNPVPCDTSAPVYRVKARHGQLIGVQAERVIVADRPAFWVNHFKTCSNADDFSRGKGKTRKQVDDLVAAAGALVGASMVIHPMERERLIDCLRTAHAELAK
jgi:hypothetical protein